jgi:phage terminase Nu1 subunit (DNA packaging protein)
MRQLVVGGGGEQAAAHGASERARLAKEQADAVAFKNAVARGALLDAGEVERGLAATCADIRAGVLAASGRFASRLPHITVSDVAVLEEELRAALSGLGGGA